jgi:thiol-disulfide isomerase/thioredoxin
MVRMLWILLLSFGLSEGVLANSALESIEALEAHKTTQVQIEAQDPYVLTFFYMGSCGHCHRFAPVLEGYARDAGLQVKSFTLDGKVIEGFGEAEKPDEAIKQTFFPDLQMKTPALFLVNTARGEIYTVSIGALTERELEARMHSLKEAITAHEEGEKKL